MIHVGSVYRFQKKRPPPSSLGSGLLLTLLGVGAGLAGCGEELGEPAPLPLVELRTATDAECRYGGQIILTGYDVDRDGSLDPREVDHEEPVCNGNPGDDGQDGTNGMDGQDGTDGMDGQDGVDGLTPLVSTSSIAPGAQCEHGGILFESGLDTDGDGALDPSEVTARIVECLPAGVQGPVGVGVLVRTSSASAADCGARNGVVVEFGRDLDRDGVLQDAEVETREVVCSGADGATALADVISEPAGAACPRGGQRLRAGLDLDGDGVLDANEVTTEALLCEPAQPLVDIAPELAGTSTVCADGGSRVRVGLDEDGDGVLDPNEVGQTSYICSGADGTGLSSLVNVDVEPAGAHCPSGGQRIQSGVDANDNGTLEAAEIARTSFVCNGSSGASGTNPALRILDEAPGANCAFGGVLIQTGPDTNGNGLLEDSEVHSAQYNCHPRTVDTLLRASRLAPGADCANGGTRIELGLDDDGDGNLSSAEVDETTFVCDGSSGTIPFAILTATLPEAQAEFGELYSADLEARGGIGGDYQWSVVQGSLPPGLSLRPTGTPISSIEGTPTASGEYSFTVQVRDFFGHTATQSYQLEVPTDPVRITRFTVPTFATGRSYSVDLSAEGGQGPYTWRVVAGALPAGLSLASNGEIRGTPTDEVRGWARIEVTDASSPTTSAVAAYRFAVEPRVVAWGGEFQATGFDGGVAGIRGTSLNGVVFGPIAPIRKTDFLMAIVNYVDAVRISPDGMSVAYVTGNTVGEAAFVAPLTGTSIGTPQRISRVFTDPNMKISQLLWAGAGHIFYTETIPNTVDWSLPDSEDLLIADLSVPSPLGQVINVRKSHMDARVSPDGDWIAYRDNEGLSTYRVSDGSSAYFPKQTHFGRVEFAPKFSQSSDAIEATPLIVTATSATPTARILAGRTGSQIPEFSEFSPDGRFLAFAYDLDLYLVDILSGDYRALDRYWGDFYWHPDSSKYLTASLFFGLRLHQAQIQVDPGDSTVSNFGPTLATSGRIGTPATTVAGSPILEREMVQIDPNGNGVYYTANFYARNRFQLGYVSFDNQSSVTLVDTNMRGSSDVHAFQIAAEGQRIVFLGDETPGTMELFVVDVTSPGNFTAPRRVNGALQIDGDVTEFHLTPDGESVIYIADQDTDEVFEVYEVSISAGAPGTSRKLSPPVASGRSGAQFLSPQPLDAATQSTYRGFGPP